MTLRERIRLIRIKQKRGNHPHSVDISKEAECECMNCHTVFRGSFCPHCGQKASTRRLSTKNVMENMLGHFHEVDNKFVHTLFELFYRPGYMVRDYIKGHRNEYIRPVPMILLLATTFVFLHLILIGELKFEEPVINLEQGNNPNEHLFTHPYVLKAVDMLEKLWEHKALRELVKILIMVPAIWLCFRKTKIGRVTNTAEIFHLAAFNTCISLTLAIITVVCDRLCGSSVFTDTGMSFLFFILAVHQFFELRWWRSIWLSIATYIVYFCIIMASILIITFALFATGLLQIK